MNRSLRYAFTAAVAALGIGASTPASATMLAAVCNDLACTGGDDTFITDNGAGDLSGQSGAIIYATSVFGYSFLLDVAQSKPTIGSPIAPQLDLNFVATTADAVSHTIFLFASDTDFLSGGDFLLTLGGTNSGGSGTVTGRAWGGTDNIALSHSGANVFATLGPLSGGAYSDSASGSFDPIANPFSLTIGTAITRSTAGTSTGDLNLQVSPVPEPSTWAMMILGFGAIGLTVRRRKVALPQLA